MNELRIVEKSRGNTILKSNVDGEYYELEKISYGWELFILEPSNDILNEGIKPLTDDDIIDCDFNRCGLGIYQNKKQILDYLKNK
tara:strand:+ start:378 stop:632 length:255 start_codon:yes stop_codon:yes gene_type:complete